MTRYELLQSISQGENGTLSRENEELALIANDIVRATTSGSYNEEKYGAGPVDAVDLNYREQREAEKWAVESKRWIPFSNVFDLGLPFIKRINYQLDYGTTVGTSIQLLQNSREEFVGAISGQASGHI